MVVKNRRGIKIEISCSPKDSIGEFKAIVVYESGSQQETILLKGQGTRPYKDTLTLEDYEIGDGSSLDLVLATAK